MKGQRCKGLIGLIFGHKFLQNKGGYTCRANFCLRCGMMPGVNE